MNNSPDSPSLSPSERLERLGALPAIQMFPPELRTASIVPRWSVVWTLTRDTVANHSFYVAMYAESIARLIAWLMNPKIIEPARADVCRLALHYLALVHDLDETITGDIVSPVKDEILDPERYDQYVHGMMQQRMPGVYDQISNCLRILDPGRLNEQAWDIIKAADRLDALLFLIGEQRMGNGVIAPRIPSAEANLLAAWHRLPAPKAELERLWSTVMLPVIAAHRTSGGQGV